MQSAGAQITTIDQYIAAAPEAVRERLQTLRQAILDEAPEAVEAIAYQMPTFRLKGKNLVHFGAFKSHIGFYPTPSGTEAFEAELTPYKRAKGSIQFPHSEPLPLPLIRSIVSFRVAEVTGKG